MFIKLNSTEAYVEARKGKNIKENEAIVLRARNGSLSFYFARYVPGANIKAHEQIIIESNDSGNCYLFARHIPSANVKELEKVVLAERDCDYCFWFARDVKGANIKAHLSIIKNNPDFKEEVSELEKLLICLSKFN